MLLDRTSITADGNIAKTPPRPRTTNVKAFDIKGAMHDIRGMVIQC
jgi:hypothetical protein